jgi:hypothetical protein
MNPSGYIELADGAGRAAVKRAILNQAASGTQQTVVAAVTGKRIRVLALAMVAGASATNATFLSNSTTISPLFANGANGGAVLPVNEHGWFETAEGEALKITTSSGATTGVLVTYLEV